MAGVHQINTYWLRFYGSKLTTNWGGFTFKSHGWIVCDSNSSPDRLVITIAPDDEPLHGGETVNVAGGDVGFIAIRRAEVNTIVDLLRNESPVSMQIYSGSHGGFNNFFIGSEPVGEGELQAP